MPSHIQLAKWLGWTSLAVGATELAATRWLEKQMGVRKHETLIQAFGVREIVAGVSILAQPGLNRNLAASLWARVAGDALDLAALGLAGTRTRNPKGLATITGIVLAVTGLDVLVATGVQRDLRQATEASRRARARVQPAIANPNGAVAVEQGHASVAAPAAVGQ